MQMCWKQEWAAAIGDIQDAIEHIDIAQGKLERRYEKNLDALAHKSGRHFDKWATRTIMKQIQTNKEGIAHCKVAKLLLKERQDHIYQMILEFGITNRGEDNRRLAVLLHGYKPGE